MSGGFFRGTSADQDTRFSNKQAKLLKSQKFAPELENLVDMTKVKMDIMRPWIARRVTELIGFEDEVLINFIYGLLEGKQVDGKQVQISLTGFMERNTGKFMKELWVLLLSAQQNVSGVPQQFLDAKEEETKKKKAETDRIAAEIQKKKEKEKQEAEQEKTKMDGDGAMSRERHADLKLNVGRGSGPSSIQPADDREQHKRNGLLNTHRRGLQSPVSFRHSQSPSRQQQSISPIKSSHSRSRSNERQRSRSIHGVPSSRSRSISLEKCRGPSPKRSLTPRRRRIIRRTPSPRRRSSYSHSRRRSPSPSRYRVRSPLHHESGSPIHRRSRSPVWRRSRTPIRKSLVRSPSPLRHRVPSPVRRRTRSPRHESPSPSRRRYRRSPSTPQQRSISPVRRRSSMYGRKRSITPVRQRFSPRESSSPSHIGCSSLSPIRRASPKGAKSLTQRPGGRARPVHTLRSPQRDMLDQSNLLRKELVTHSMRKSSFDYRDRSDIEEQRSTSPHGSPYQRRENMLFPVSPNTAHRAPGHNPCRDSSGTSADDDNKFSRRSSRKVSPTPMHHKYLHEAAEVHGPADGKKSRNTQLPNSDRKPEMLGHYKHGEKMSTTSKTSGLSVQGRKLSNTEGTRVKDRKIVMDDDSKGGYRSPELEAVPKLSLKSELNDQNDSFDLPSKQSEENKVKSNEKSKRQLDRQEVDSDDHSSYDSYEERKESKRRKEKKLKREERRRRREERRRRRDGRCAEKLKFKSIHACSSSSDLERVHSENESIQRRDLQDSITQGMDSDQRRLEKELREKALESLLAKKRFAN